jgi:protein involved in polysaccharide export with SLBB domain
LPAGATLLDALAAAGGGSPTAQLRKLSIVRGPAGEKPTVLPHDADAVLRGQSTNPALLDRDTVFVPERIL